MARSMELAVGAGTMPGRTLARPVGAAAVSPCHGEFVDHHHPGAQVSWAEKRPAPSHGGLK